MPVLLKNIYNITPAEQFKHRKQLCLRYDMKVTFNVLKLLLDSPHEINVVPSNKHYKRVEHLRM